MQPPRFWYGAGGRDAAPMLQLLARPLAWIYAGVTAAKIARTTPLRASIPVICIGNLTVGGAGKTPVARAVRSRLATQGVSAHTLSRGHGGRLEGPIAVGVQHTAADVGDEPLLHARDGPAWIARDRAAAASVMTAAGADAILMDDGFQNPALAKDLSLLVFDAASGAGNGRVVPAGPLREPLAAGLRRADGVVVLHGETAETDDLLTRALDRYAGSVLHARLAPTAPAPAGPLVAFAGIGRPVKFFDTLTAHGGDVVDALSFPDHHPYSNDDLRRLDAHAAHHKARLVTTEKDHVRLSPAWRDRILTLPVSATFDDLAALDALLARVTARKAA